MGFRARTGNGSLKIKLYSYRRCPFAMRVRMTLHEKNIEFETQEEDLSNFSDELREAHPEARVPVLVHGEKIIYESAIITEYLDEAFPKISLMPSSPGLRAEVRLWTYWCNYIFKSEVDRFKYGMARFPAEECEGSEARLKNHLDKINNTLGEFLVDGRLTLADIHVFPFLRQLDRMSPRPGFLGDYPSAMQWLKRLVDRPSFKATMKK